MCACCAPGGRGFGRAPECVMESPTKVANHLKVVRDGQSRGAGVAKVAFLGDEQAFLQALRARDPAAIAALFDAQQGMVLAVLARVLGVDSELRDLLQEVFLRALRGVHTVRDGRVLQQWLRRNCRVHSHGLPSAAATAALAQTRGARRSGAARSSSFKFRRA